MIRINPMDKMEKEFANWSIEEIQKNYFETGYIKKTGEYWYPNKGLDAEDNDLVLFQMKNKIIASARYNGELKPRRFKKPNEEGYRGAWLVYPDTIKTFQPITVEKLKEIIPSFERFSQSKLAFNEQDVEMKKLEELMKKEA